MPTPVAEARWQSLDVGDCFARLRSGPAGLASAEARRRLAEAGPNRVAQAEGAGMLPRLARQFTHLLAAVLLVAALLAFVADWRGPGQGMATLGWAILGVVAVNGLFSFWQEHRAARALRSLRDLLPGSAKVLRDGRLAEVAAEELVAGDLLLLERGDRVPADARLVEALGVKVVAAALTGESVPEERSAEPVPVARLPEASSVLLAGTFVVAGSGRALVFATGPRTELGRVAGLTASAGEALSPLQREIARLGRVIALLATALGLACLAIGHRLGLPAWTNFVFALGIIVANVPEGLLPTVTLSLAMASQRMARRNALVRHLASVEALGSATVICTDKTGTLTRNEMEAAELLVGGRRVPLAGASPPELARDHRRLLEAALFCNDVRETVRGGRAELAGDPLDVALVRLARAALPGAEAPRADELPFDWARRRQSTLHRTASGLVLYTKGAPEWVLPACRAVEVDGREEPLAAGRLREVVDAGEGMARDGLRVLALAWRAVAPGEPRQRLEEGLVLAGLVGLADPPRPGVGEAIAHCREAGIRVVMITGDHPGTALAVARAVGLVRAERPRLVLGDELRGMEERDLASVLGEPELLFARVDPGDKLRIVEALKARGEVVAVTGDGVNDAPALRAAHIGIAMGRSGTDVARDAADVVLADDDFTTIAAAVEEGRAVFANIRKFMTYILTSNVPELVPYLVFAFLGAPLALTVVQILAVDLGTDLLPALALGAEPPGQAALRRLPARGRHLFDRALFLRAYPWLGGLEAAGSMAVFFLVLGAGGWRWGDPLSWSDPLYRTATTACLATVVAMQVANLFACRTALEPLGHRPARANPLILGGVAVELLLLLAIVYTPVGHAVFGTAPLPGWVWLAAAPCAAALLVLEQGRKWIVRRSPRARRAARASGG